MPLKMVVDGKLVGESVFESSMDPGDVRRLAVDRPPVGWISLVVLSQLVTPLNGRLEFEMSGARVLQIGESQKVLFILENSPGPALQLHSGPTDADQTRAGKEGSIQAVSRSVGDGRFLSELPESLRPTGDKLLREVRRVYHGSLVYHGESQKYVDSPDNFWTVKIQRRARDLAITVRGNPADFSVSHGLTLKSDRPGYSRFKISRPEHVERALRVLTQARRRN